MKKLLIVLLALTVIGTFAVAQDAPKPVSSIGAWSEGIVNLYNQSGSADATADWGPSWAGAGGYQSFSIGYAGNNYGFNSLLETNNDLWATSFSRASAYYNFGTIAKITIGKVRDGTYRAPGALIESQFVKRIASAENGALVQLTPIDGLSVGVFANVATAGQMVADYSKNVNFGAAYAMPDLFNATLTYRTVDKIFNAGASITAIKPVTVVVGFQNDQNASSTFVYGSVGTKLMDVLTVNADVGYKSATVTAMAFEGMVEYALGQYAVGARVGYDDGKGCGLLGNNDNIGAGMTGVYIYPYAAANFDNGSSVRIGVAYGSGANSVPALLQIPLLYIYSF